MTHEEIIFPNLFKNAEYVKKVFPFLKKDYFHQAEYKVLYDIFGSYYKEYGRIPDNSTLKLYIDNYIGTSDDVIKSCKKILPLLLEQEPTTDEKWLLDMTEQFCKDSDLVNTVKKAVSIIDDPKKDKGILPELFKNSLAITFDTSIGHDYLEDFLSRYETRHDDTKRLPFDLEMFNKITGNGLPPKTLSIIVAGINVGKSLCLCHLASSWLCMGKNVLYITLEMSEEQIGDRIDANCLDIAMSDLYSVSKEAYTSSIMKLKKKRLGKLVIKEYPTGTGSVLHFESLLTELRIKKNFIPDVILVDYVNICASAGYSGSQEHERVKKVCEELRAMGIEKEVPIVSATQFNREGFNSSDPSMNKVASSFDMLMCVDMVLALNTNEELEKLGQYLVTQLKTRFGDKRNMKKFIIGVDYTKQRLYDVSNSAQEDVVEKKEPEEFKPFFQKKQNNKDKFKGFKTT